MDINQARFPQELLKIVNEIAESHFIAFDLEFSGIAGRRQGGTGKLSLQEFYDDTRIAAEKYQILQVGLTVVKEDLVKGHYVARPYNFNISPLTSLRERHFGRVWSHHSGAVSFLTRHGFDFALPITQGVQYLSRQEEQQARSTMVQEEESRSKMADMELKAEDNALISHIRTAVSNWQAQSKGQAAEFLNIPVEVSDFPQTLNRYQVRLVHQIVRNEYANLKTQGMGHFVQITNPTAEQQTSSKQFATQQRENDIARAIGFRWVIEAMTGGNISGIPNDWLVSGLAGVDVKDKSPQAFVTGLQEKLRARRRVVVGHNCFTDLVYLYKCFIGTLPRGVEDFQDEIRILFPGVIDTKHIATAGSKKWGNTSLEEVEIDMRSEAVPLIEVPAEYARYQYASSYHEAGYDSLLTARIAIKLSAKMEREKIYLEGAEDGTNEGGLSKSTFGADNDGYVSAAESVSSLIDQDDGLMRTLSKALKSPLTAAKAFFDKGQISPRPAKDEDVNPTAATFGQGSRLIDDGAPATPINDDVKEADGESTGMSTTGGVFAAKERIQTSKWSDKDEVEKVKNALVKTNIYDVLEKDLEGPESGTDDDLMSFGSGSSGGVSLGVSKSTQMMVKKGEIMPRWDDEKGFWGVFGNKLQVNGAKERVFSLD